MGRSAVQEIAKRRQKPVGLVLAAADLVVRHAAEYSFIPPGIIDGLLVIAEAFLHGGTGIDIIARQEHFPAEDGFAIDKSQEEEQGGGSQVGTVLLEESIHRMAMVSI